MDSTTDTATGTGTATAGELLGPVLADLETVMAQVTPDQFGQPTPCSDFDVAALRAHILGWVTFFGAAVADPDATAERPDPASVDAPDEPQQAATLVASAAQKISAAVEAGIEQRPVKLTQGELPGSAALSLILWECLMHGNDLAAATGQPWQQSEQAAQVALDFASTMLSDDYRGPGKDFGPAVDVPDDAPALDRLIGFSGRDPHWAPATP